MSTQEALVPNAITSHPECAFVNLRPRIASPFKKLCNGIDLHYTYDGRGALFQIFRQLPPRGRRELLLPAFHCPTMVEPAIQAGYRPRFYRIRKNLNIDVDDFLNCLDDSVAAAVAVNYFGFPANLDELRNACAAIQAPLIEDCAHSFLNADPIRLAGDRADLAVFSFKKLVPSYVGGAIRNNSGQVTVQSSSVRPPLTDSIVNMKRMIDQSINTSSSRLLHALQGCLDAVHTRLKSKSPHASVNTNDTGDGSDDQYPFHRHLATAGIPWYARYVLQTAQLGDIVAARQKNYEAMVGHLSSIPGVALVTPGSVSSVCPWACPTLVENRSSIDWQLRSRGVPLFTFGETLHPTLLEDSVASKEAINDALHLSSSLLCLSIHQSVPTQSIGIYVDHMNDVLGSR